ncbi:hypothetical protein L615_008300000100 [Nocardioides sp. J9]|uniref:hypothetical protein n=1 Tax=Nocardioides sp. J9 TaxID=935844 RepID=UPI0011A173F1|nr:hypothetical protein [Nocardioides sp. J9]TWG91132.1 hypothetical protein L615_008300000100 [Nocardioides sp. J9]
MDRHTVATRVAVLLAVLLGTGELGRAVGVGPGGASVTAAVLAPVTLVAAVALSRRSCLETRLPVVVVVGAQLLATGLALAVGLPGQARTGLGVQEGATIVLVLGVLVALDVDRRARARSAVVPPGSPYAR